MWKMWCTAAWSAATIYIYDVRTRVVTVSIDSQALREGARESTHDVGVEERALDAEERTAARGPLGVRFRGLALERCELVAPEPMRVLARLCRTYAKSACVISSRS